MIIAIAVMVVFLFTRGGDTGAQDTCDLFNRSFGVERETELTEFELADVLGDIREMADGASSEMRAAAEALFIASQSQDAAKNIAAAAAMGSACAEAR